MECIADMEPIINVDQEEDVFAFNLDFFGLKQ